MQNQPATPPPGEPSRPAISAGGSISADSGIIAGGNVNRSNNKKISFGGILVALVAIVALFLVGRAVVVNLNEGTDAASGDVTRTAVGSWTASDGSGTKTFGGNGAGCDGFYYHQGKPLDIGGPMTCTLSSAPDSQNRYSLIVKQGPNQATYKIDFDQPDHAVVYGSNGAVLYQLTRF